MFASNSTGCRFESSVPAPVPVRMEITADRLMRLPLILLIKLNLKKRHARQVREQREVHTAVFSAGDAFAAYGNKAVAISLLRR